MMTADEFLESKIEKTPNGSPCWGVGRISKIMVEFAKIHVKAALEAANNNVQKEMSVGGYPTIDVIHEAYPLDSIK